MKYKVGYIVFVFLLSVSTASYAQMQFNFNGLGRAIVTSNKMGGETLKNDTLSPSKGVSGYTLFDLQPNIIVGNTVRVNSILRLRNPFGSFYGANTAFSFRQFQIMGRIGKTVEYELGDIYLGGMTKYTMYKPFEMDHEYESEIHRIRRSVAEYENFVNGNMWRLQGVQGRSLFGFNKGIKTLGVNVFAVRTNATNDKDVADRILAGGRLSVVQSGLLSLGVNYVGLMDIKINSDAYEYSNRVITGDAKVTLDKEAFLLQLNGEFGGSNFKNVDVFNDSTAKYSDYVTEGGAKLVIKSAKLKVYGSYRSVGAQFSSPTAQTARIRADATPSLFGMVNSNTTPRNVTLNDRLTDEQIYNRSVSAVLYNYLPQYGNITPYGDATPNRAGMNFGIGSDTSAKIIKADINFGMFSEIIGEGVADKRKYTSLKGGLLFNFGDLLKLNRKMSVNIGARQEMTKRGGDAPVDFKSLLLDFGGSFEVFKQFDVLAGVKMLNASGNEYLSIRNQFNLLSAFPEYKLDLKEGIYSFGVRVRFGEKSYFTGNYNISNYKDTQSVNYNYNINQLFFNYTLIF
jgi:hypothetical protein